MEILGRIKRLYFRDKKSLHEIARLTGLSRNTIRKWLREPKVEEALKYVRKDIPTTGMSARFAPDTRMTGCGREYGGKIRDLPDAAATSVL